MRCVASAEAISVGEEQPVWLGSGPWRPLPYIHSVTTNAAAMGPCDPASTNPALLSPIAAVSAAFGTAGGTGTLSCQVCCGAA